MAFVMENVPGLMASRIDGQRLPLYLAKQFEEMGYKVSILKLVATDFFVPQKRQRVLMVGHRIPGKNFEIIKKANPVAPKVEAKREEPKREEKELISKLIFVLPLQIILTQMRARVN